jgi:hypothetical protein
VQALLKCEGSCDSNGAAVFCNFGPVRLMCLRQRGDATLVRHLLLRAPTLQACPLAEECARKEHGSCWVRVGRQSLWQDLVPFTAAQPE